MGDHLENRGPASPREAKKLVKQLKKQGHTAKYVGRAYGYMLAHYPKDDQVTVLSVMDRDEERAIIPAYRGIIENALEEYGPSDLVQFLIIKLDDDHEFVCGVTGV